MVSPNDQEAPGAHRIVGLSHRRIPVVRVEFGTMNDEPRTPAAIIWSVLLFATVVPTFPPRDPPDAVQQDRIVVPLNGPFRITGGLGPSSTATTQLVAEVQLSR